MRGRLRITVVALCALAFSGWIGSSANAAVEGVDLTLRGQTSLPSIGQDGTTKARGQNGDVAILGDYAFVAGGSKNHGALYTPGRICTDFGGVKVVDISNPANPTTLTAAQINIADTKTVLTGPKGNPRRTANIPNVASTASSVDIFRNPVANKDILAVTTERCEQSFFDGARIEFWDVTNPTSPSMIGKMDPEDIINPLCTPGTPPTCPPGTSPVDGRWGIFEDVRMFSRNNGPGGSTKVYAIATSPFSIGNTGGVSFVGDFRLIDITNPANPQQVTSFPTTPIGQSTNNGCKTFQAARSAAPTPDRSRAIVSYYDGAQPVTTAITPYTAEAIHNDFGITNSAALFDLSLDNLPQLAGGTGSNASPKTFAPNPKVFGYPAAADGGETAAGRVEGNAADVETFTGPDGHVLAMVSEEDIDPAVTQVTIDGPPSAAYTGRGCAHAGAWNKIYLKPAQALTDDVAYVGRGCPASKLVNSALVNEDPYLADPNGKIALLESGGDGFNGCSLSLKAKRAFDAGAVGVMTNLGGDFLSSSSAGPDGGMPDIPNIGVQLTAFNKMAGYVPNRVLAGTTFPAGWELLPPSVTSNANVKPLAAPLGCATPTGGSAITAENCVAATNETPIKIRTTTAHGLATGDRVTIAGVAGNTAANGTFTVTVPNAPSPPESPGTTVFTLDGTSGSGAYTGGGYVVQCAPGVPNCSVPASARADISRFRSVANVTDPVAGVRVKAANQWAVTAGQSYRAGVVLEVAERTVGSYDAVVEWFDAGGLSLGTSPIQSLSAVTARTAYNATVTAPPNAVKGGMTFRWTGAGAAGTAYADSYSFTPTGLTVTLKDNQGAWGEQKIVDFTATPPAVVGTYQSPRAKVWPPPNNGVFMPREARMFDNELAFTAWMTDGLRVLNVTDPTNPTEVAVLVPPGVADPSPAAGAGVNNATTGGPFMSRGFSWPTQTLINSVAVRKLGANSARLVLTDINGGLFVVDAAIRRPSTAPPPPPPPPPPATTPPPPAAPPPPVAAGADKVAPAVSAFSVSPASFKASSSGSSISSKGAAKVKYRLSEAATARFTVERVVKGRKRGGKCEKPSTANRKGASCTLYVKVSGSFTHKGKSGANQFSFSGRLAGRKLGAGSYRLTAVAKDAAGNTGKAKTARFKVRR